MAIDRVFSTPTITVDQDRYDELVKSELKAKQYKNELKRIGEYDYLIDIIEATEIQEKTENKKEESEEKQ